VNFPVLTANAARTSPRRSFLPFYPFFCFIFAFFPFYFCLFTFSAFPLPRLAPFAVHTSLTPHSSPFTLHCSRFTLHSLHSSPFTPHPSLFTLHPSPFTLHPSPFTLHPSPFTFHCSRFTVSHLNEKKTWTFTGQCYSYPAQKGRIAHAFKNACTEIRKGDCR